MVALDEENLRAMQLPANFLRPVPEFEGEIAQKIHVIFVRNVTIPVVDEHLVMRFDIRKRSLGIANDVRMGKVRVGDEPAIFHKSNADR
jgi:hypothetical protein